MTRTKLDTPAFADQSVDSRNIADGAVQAQDITGLVTGTQLAGSIANDKLANSSFTIGGSSISLGGSSSLGVLVTWQAVTVADGSTTLTAEAGKGYFLDTNTGVIEVFLPSSPNRGDVVILVDYSGTFSTNMCIINTGGQLIDSTVGSEVKLTTNNTIAELVYVDSNKGWLVKLNQAAGTTPSGALTGGQYGPATFITATGGTVTTSGDYKIHTFTGDSNFVVASIGNSATPAPQRDKVDYLVAAGGASGGFGDIGGGGGAGGFRLSNVTCMPGPQTSPLANPTGITVSATTYPITVGGGGAPVNISSSPTIGTSGSNSIFSTITSAGGGGGGGNALPIAPGQPGGSGGGASYRCGTGGSGNTPPVSPPQGNNGGTSASPPQSGAAGSGGGGGAGAVGVNGTRGPTGEGGPGGVGSFVVQTGFGGCNGTTGPVSGTRYFSGGGGGSVEQGTNTSGGTGGSGGGGNAFTASPSNTASTAGAANTGGGGGGGENGFSSPGAAGGKGIVILRYKFQ